jgi:hypothetical protein
MSIHFMRSRKCNKCGKHHSDQDSLAKHEIGYSVDNECPLCEKNLHGERIFIDI